MSYDRTHLKPHQASAASHAAGSGVMYEMRMQHSTFATSVTVDGGDVDTHPRHSAVSVKEKQIQMHYWK